MAIPKDNVVDLRKPSLTRRKPAKKETKPVVTETVDFPPEADPPLAGAVSPIVKIATLAFLGALLAGLAAYFAISQNYLASVLFILAGSTLAIAVFGRKKPATKQNHKKPDSLTDLLAKIIGL
jgi:hypothetical protein